MMKLYTVLDFETTGLNDPIGSDQPTQVCAIKYDENGKEVARFSTYVKIYIGKPISEYTPHITPELCQTGMTVGGVLDSLYHFTRRTTIVCQSAPFDLSFLDWDISDFICTRALTWLVEPNENPSLAPTCERHGIKHDFRHDAIDDVEATKEVLFLMMKKAEEKGIEYRNVVVDFKKRPLKFTPEYAKVIKE